MLSLKTNLIIAFPIGAIISAVLLAVEPVTDYAYLSWEWPGISAADFFGGSTGGSSLGGIAICWVVNALAYGLCAFAILSIVSALKLLAAPKT